MKKNHENSELMTEVMELVRSLHDILDMESVLKGQLNKLTGKINAMNMNLPAECGKRTAPPSKVIIFPGVAKLQQEYIGSGIHKSIRALPIMALPGKTLPSFVTDYRQNLQRDGLILLAWDKRLTEMGDRYTAYWVTSIGIPRYYASKPLCQNEFLTACPDHKSYAAEDGIEFYGQKAPVYLVHVAPELMMSNPLHRELRMSHISTLKRYGCKVNFNYKFLLKNEKKRKASSRKPFDGKAS